MTSETPGGGPSLLARIFRPVARRRVCPHCRSPLEAREPPAACPLCDRPLTDAQGRRLRPLDVGFEAQLAELDDLAMRRTVKGTVLALVLCLLGFWFPPLAGVVLFFVQLIWVRLAIVGPYRRHFGTTRRIVTRWITRFLLVSGAGLHLAAILPGVQIVASPLIFASLCAAAWRYHRWHLVREHEHVPISLLEKLLLWTVAAVFVSGMIGIGLLIWLFGELTA